MIINYPYGKGKFNTNNVCNVCVMCAAHICVFITYICINIYQQRHK